VASTGLPKSFSACAEQGGDVQGSAGGRTCTYQADFGQALYADCAIVSGEPGRKPERGGDVRCWVTYSEGGSCSAYVEELVP
jgi:hypothetical protein